MILALEIDRKSSKSLQVQVFDQVKNSILRKELLPGKPLPATRVLSHDLGVSRNTIVIAFERLINEGYLETRGSAGTFVSEMIPEDLLGSQQVVAQNRLTTKIRVPLTDRISEANQQDTVGKITRNIGIDLRAGRSGPHIFPTKTWRRLLQNRLSTLGSKISEEIESIGLEELRIAISRHIGPAKGISCRPDQILITTGPTEAINIISKMFIGQGTEVIVEDPCSRPLVNILRSYGAQLVPAVVEKDGLNFNVLQQENAKLIFTTPAHHFPLGVTMSFERRLRLLDLIRKVGGYVIEDDYDGEIRYDGPPIRSLFGSGGQDNVIHVGSFATFFGAGFGLGYIVVPEDLIGPARTAKGLTSNGGSWLQQAVLADFIEDGNFSRHIRRVTGSYRLRRDNLISAFKTAFVSAEISGASGGLHVFWSIPKELPSARWLEEKAMQKGVTLQSLYSSDAIELGSSKFSNRGIIIGYGSISEKKIWEAISRLSDVLEDNGFAQLLNS